MAFAAIKEGKAWNVMHVESGQSAYLGVRRKRDAKALADALAAVPTDYAPLSTETRLALIPILREWMDAQRANSVR